MAKAIMVQGTMSNVGKSLITAGLCRIFQQDGYRVAPFKSQNMALNSFITADGMEMGRAQVMQAEAAGIAPDVRMNPILLKPTNDVGSQVIVNGEVLGTMSARDYFAFKHKLVPDVMKAFHALSAENDIIVIEGGQSCGGESQRRRYCQYGHGENGEGSGASGRRHRPGRRVRAADRHCRFAGSRGAEDGQGSDHQQIPRG